MSSENLTYCLNLRGSGITEAAPLVILRPYSYGWNVCTEVLGGLAAVTSALEDKPCEVKTYEGCIIPSVRPRPLIFVISVFLAWVNSPYEF